MRSFRRYNFFYYLINNNYIVKIPTLSYEVSTVDNFDF